IISSTAGTPVGRDAVDMDGGARYGWTGGRPCDASQPLRRLGHGAEQRAALVHGLVPFLFRVGIEHDAGAGLHVQAAALDDRGTDRDRGIGVAVPADVADRAGVDVALDRLE